MKRVSRADLAVGVIACATAAASIWASPGPSGFLGAGLALLMLAIAVTDFRHMIIPDALSIAAAALAAVSAAVGDPTAIVASVATVALRGTITMLFFLAIRAAYRRLRQREGLGLGDVKLAFVAGAWLDWVMIPVAIEIAAVAALIAFFALQVLAKRPLNSTSRLPFGLFFAPAIWLSWLLGAAIFGPM
jgi:leader peptidase (prepilin peptidase)/N-methyltransferase